MAGLITTTRFLKLISRFSQIFDSSFTIVSPQFCYLSGICLGFPVWVRRSQETWTCLLRNENCPRIPTILHRPRSAWKWMFPASPSMFESGMFPSRSCAFAVQKRNPLQARPKQRRLHPGTQLNVWTRATLLCEKARTRAESTPTHKTFQSRHVSHVCYTLYARNSCCVLLQNTWASTRP